MHKQQKKIPEDEEMKEKKKHKTGDAVTVCKFQLSKKQKDGIGNISMFNSPSSF